MKLNCLIVDDEPLQQEILKDYIEEVELLNLVEIFSDGVDVVSYLKKERVDLIFLDINMPLLNGIDMVKRLTDPPAIIFTTAHPEYAVDGFNLDAVDYLLKPISFERFGKAVDKFKSRVSLVGKSNVFSVRVDKKDYRINYNDILYFEGCGDYVKLFLTDNVLTFHSTLKSVEATLPGNQFIRIHKSNIVALSKIRYVEGNCLSVNNVHLQIGKSYQDNFNQVWGR